MPRPVARDPENINPVTGGKLVSAEPFRAPTEVAGDARLLVHEMVGVSGGLVRASTLLFVPPDPPPAGGWPLVAWVHGTTTGGDRLRAPSLSPTLDGGLTADGYVTRWVRVVASLVGAGYAVAAPDLEGKGAVASVPIPYYDASSLARSQLAGLRAARQADERLSERWASVGHSDGGHGALVAEAHAGEAPELDFVGSVAFAPFTSVTAIVDHHGEQAARHPKDALAHVVQQNFNVGLMTAGLQALDPAFDVDLIMGADLARLMPSFRTEGSVGIVSGITEAVRSRTPRAFSGFHPHWHTVPAVRDFLARNDPAAIPAFSLHRPSIILQGGRDVSVPARLTEALVGRLAAAGDPVRYRAYPEADHFSLLPEALPAALDFLAEQFGLRPRPAAPALTALAPTA